jgi:hypothetical protein
LKPVLKPGGEYYSPKSKPDLKKRMFLMKNKLALIALSAQKINRQHVQLVLVLVSLVMLVIGVGAPMAEGGGR